MIDWLNPNHDEENPMPTLLPRHVRSAFLLACCALVLRPAAAASVEQTVGELVQRFSAAQSTFDMATLKAVTADNYIEISPLGEVDPREKMLSFYVRKDDKPRPAIAVDEITTRVLGDTAVGCARQASTMRRRVASPSKWNRSASWPIASSGGVAIAWARWAWSECKFIIDV